MGMITGVRASGVTLVLLLAAWLSGCANVQTRALEGRWTVSTLDGNRFEIRIRATTTNEYYLYQPEGHLSGKYAKKKGQLLMREADNPRTSGFVINIIDESQLRIIEAPEVRLTGIRYQGANIGRSDVL